MVFPKRLDMSNVSVILLQYTKTSSVLKFQIHISKTLKVMDV